MALSYPLTPAQFQDQFKISVAEFFLKNPREVNTTSGGAQLSASVGFSVWLGTFTLVPTNDRSLAAKRDALLSVLDRTGSSFLVYDPAKTHPAADPTGSILGAATPTLTSVNALDNREITLGGLPVGYQLTAGDYIGIRSGAKYWLHRVVTDVAGATPTVEVTPFANPEMPGGAEVTLIKPMIKAVLSPNPNYGAHRAVVSGAAQYSFAQTMV